MFVIIFAIIAPILQFVVSFAHWFVYKTAVRFLVVQNPKNILILEIFFIVFSFTFLTATLISSSFDNIATQLFYKLSAVWISIFLLLFMAALLFWIVYGLAHLFSFSFNAKLLAEILTVAAVFLSVYGIVNAGNVRVTQVTVDLPNLPGEWKGKTAAWVSDLHLGQVRGYGFSQYIADKIQALHPDIVFIGGDFYDGVAADLDKLAEPFSHLNAPLGAYFVTGNHEEFADNTKYLEALKKAGIRILTDEMVKVDGLQIIGVDYGTSRDNNKFREVLNKVGIDKSTASILLKHVPDDLDVAEAAGISFQISGHDHNGQIFPAKLVDRILYDGAVYGFARFGNMLEYTSSGAGTWGPPMRIGSAPEIALMRLE